MKRTKKKKKKNINQMEAKLEKSIIQFITF